MMTVEMQLHITPNNVRFQAWRLQGLDRVNELEYRCGFGIMISDEGEDQKIEEHLGEVEGVLCMFSDTYFKLYVAESTLTGRHTRLIHASRMQPACQIGWFIHLSGCMRANSIVQLELANHSKRLLHNFDRVSIYMILSQISQREQKCRITFRGK